MAPMGIVVLEVGTATTIGAIGHSPAILRGAQRQKLHCRSSMWCASEFSKDQKRHEKNWKNMKRRPVSSSKLLFQQETGTFKINHLNISWLFPVTTFANLFPMRGKLSIATSFLAAKSRGSGLLSSADAFARSSFGSSCLISCCWKPKAESEELYVCNQSRGYLACTRICL